MPQHVLSPPGQKKIYGPPGQIPEYAPACNGFKLTGSNLNKISSFLYLIGSNRLEIAFSVINSHSY